jgi:tRNA-guanine family transglycosylase
MMHRTRTLQTPSGEVETPILFPVRNIGKRSSDNTPEYTDDIPDLKTGMVNARAIRQRDAQWDRITSGASLREEMDIGSDVVLFADSGGFDFKSGEIDTTPEDTIETQSKIGADIFGTLDLPLSKDNRTSENRRRVQKSAEYALDASYLHDGDELLFASVQGRDPETIRNSVQYLEKHGEFDGYAIGGLAPIRSNYKKVIRLVLAARRATDKHLHVYGLGGIVYQPLLVYLGVDSFDSTAFIRSAGNRNYLIPGFGGEELRNIDGMEYLPCPCPVCCSTTLEEIRESRELLVKHNSWALAIELRKFRYIANSGEDIETYLDLRFQGNEVMGRAYKLAKQHIRRLA